MAGKIKVLMLDDEKFLLRVYRVAFEKRGHEVAAFSEPDAALSALRLGYEPDVLLFDITMPDSDSGYQFIQSVHNEKLAKRALKYALTNEGQDGPISRLKEIGADGHLLKANYIPDELVAKVEELLKKHRGWFAGFFT